MGRIARDQMLMEVAHVVAKRGTCSRLQVGAVFAQDGRIVVTGYNGAPRGMPHCEHAEITIVNDPDRDPEEIPAWVPGDGMGKPAPGTWYTDGVSVSSQPGCTIAEHAERNAIAFAAREGIRLKDTDVYCTHAPCYDCARALVNVGIRSIAYSIPYRLTHGVDLLKSRGIEVVDMSTAEVV